MLVLRSPCLGLVLVCVGLVCGGVLLALHRFDFGVVAMHRGRRFCYTLVLALWWGCVGRAFVVCCRCARFVSVLRWLGVGLALVLRRVHSVVGAGWRFRGRRHALPPSIVHGIGVGLVRFVLALCWSCVGFALASCWPCVGGVGGVRVLLQCDDVSVVPAHRGRACCGTLVHWYVFVCVLFCLFVCLFVLVSVSVFVSVCVCVCASVCACVCACVRVRVCVLVLCWPCVGRVLVLCSFLVGSVLGCLRPALALLGRISLVRGGDVGVAATHRGHTLRDPL